MLHGVLLIPPELWSDDPLERAQRHERYVQASRRIENDAKTIAELKESLRKNRD